MTVYLYLYLFVFAHIYLYSKIQRTMASGCAMPSWTNNASAPPQVIAHLRKGGGISYKYKYKENTYAPP